MPGIWINTTFNSLDNQEVVVLDLQHGTKDRAGNGIKQEFKVTEYSVFIPLSVKVTMLILTLN